MNKRGCLEFNNWQPLKALGGRLCLVPADRSGIIALHCFLISGSPKIYMPLGHERINFCYSEACDTFRMSECIFAKIELYAQP